MKIITGNPGTGKHTVSKRLAKRLGVELVDINKIAISEGLVKKIDDILEVDTGRLKKIIDKKVQRSALLVGHLAPYVVSRRKVEVAVVLRRDPYNLERVYRRRGYTKQKVLENIGSEILGIIYHDTVKYIGHKKTFQFDTTGKPILQTVDEIASLFAKGKARQDKIDWLKMATDKSDLKRFFPY